MFLYNENKFTVSKHCQERYVERIVGKFNKLEINTYIAKHEEKIHDDIAKMLTYGVKVYKGKALSGPSKNKEENTIILSGSWVIIYSEPKDLVITLYKVNLGVGEEFNREYAHKILDRIKSVDSRLQKASSASEEDKKRLSDELDECDAKIKRYSELLEDLKSHRGTVQKELEDISCSTKELEAQKQELISRLIGKKVF